MRIESSEQFAALQAEARARDERQTRKILVCCGTGCLATGAKEVAEAFVHEITERGLDVEVVGRLDARGDGNDVVVSADLDGMAGIVEQAYAVRLHCAEEAAHDLLEVTLAKIGLDEHLEVGGPECFGDFPGVARRCS
mgnify:CR=1 FL=1